MISGKSTKEDKNKKYHVYFSKNLQDFNDLNHPSIVFSPYRDSWNDFVYKCRYEYLILDEGSLEPIKGLVFLGFTEKSEKVAKDGRVEFDRDIIAAEELPLFFTLQGSMGNYREFIAEHGLHRSQKLLKEIHDLVTLKQTSKDTELVDKAEKTNVFQVAFMRDSERFFAYYNASSLLDGLKEESLSSISNKLSLEYKLDGFSGSHKLDLNFSGDNILPKRINVLIGCNGLGKSQSLFNIVNSLIKDNGSLTDREHGRPRISRVLAIATPGETSNTFPIERSYKRIKYRRLILNRTSRSKRSRGFCELCIQLARSEENIKEESRWGIFTNSLSALDGFDDIVIPLNHAPEVVKSHVIKIDDKYFIPLFELNSGQELSRLEVWGAMPKNANPVRLIDGKVCPLSSGQLAFLKFSVQACLFIENGTLVLLDEPETHLHPKFISDFVRLLNSLLDNTGSNAVIATHSAYFVREMTRSQVLVFKQDENGGVNIQNPRLKTFGADIGSISYFVFEDEETNVLVDELIEKFPQDKDKRIEMLNDLSGELSSEVIMHISRELNIRIESEEN